MKNRLRRSSCSPKRRRKPSSPSSAKSTRPSYTPPRSHLIPSRLAAKRAAEATAGTQEAKRNEAIRRKKTQNTEQLKEELRRKEQLKEVEARKREKIDDAKAKERVREQIKEQQEARKRQAEKDKAAREGRAVHEEPTHAPVVQHKVVASHTEARLQLRIPSGPPLIKTFPAETTLFEVASAIEEERGVYCSPLALVCC